MSRTTLERPSHTRAQNRPNIEFNSLLHRLNRCPLQIRTLKPRPRRDQWEIPGTTPAEDWQIFCLMRTGMSRQPTHFCGLDVHPARGRNTRASRQLHLATPRMRIPRILREFHSEAPKSSPKSMHSFHHNENDPAPALKRAGKS